MYIEEMEMWLLAKAKGLTCKFDKNDAEMGHYCILTDWPTPDGCINCKDYIPHENKTIGGVTNE